MSDLDSLRVDRSVYEISTLDEQGEDRDYWFSRTPRERMEALEILRQIHYGYDPATTRLQRVLTITELK